MPEKTTEKKSVSSQEAINAFFEELNNLKDVDPETASVISKLWKEDRLTRTEILSALESQRKKESQDE